MELIAIFAQELGGMATANNWSNLEDEVQDWLEENSTIEITDRKVVMTGGDADDDKGVPHWVHLAIIIFYKQKAKAKSKPQSKNNRHSDG